MRNRFTLLIEMIIGVNIFSIEDDDDVIVIKDDINTVVINNPRVLVMSNVDSSYSFLY